MPVAAVRVDFDGMVTVLPDATYETLKAALGGWIERCPADPGVSLWVDEEGKLKDLPLNMTATHLWSKVDKFHCVRAGDFVAGPCVITGGDDGAGEVTPVPAWVLEELGLVAEE
jgi:Domain of unknown function (DUF3846)